MDDRMAADLGRGVMYTMSAHWLLLGAFWAASWFTNLEPLRVDEMFAAVAPIAITVGCGWALTALVFRLVRAWWRQWSV